MKKIFALMIWAGISLLPFCDDAAAYQDQAHINLSSQALNLLIAKEGFAPSCPTYPSIIEGAVAEDRPGIRSLFHFSPRLNSWYASAGCDAIQWGFGSTDCKATLPGHSEWMSNSFDWPDAVAGAGTDGGWVALGHLLHLIEDLAVPAHTRNDPHPLNEPLEDEAESVFPHLPEEAPLFVARPEALFQQLRDYTRSRFFSRDTCFHPKLPGPTAVTENNDYFFDSEGRKIAFKGRAYRWTGNKRDCTIDSTIAQEQYQELGPIAVLYATSLIKHYSDLTNTTPCPAAAARWLKIFGGPRSEIGYSVQQTEDHGYIVTGFTESYGAGNWDLYLIKTDINGEMAWAKTYGGTNTEWGKFVQQTPDRGYIVAGMTYSFTANGKPEMYLLKTDEAGTLLWERSYHGISDTNGYSVHPTADGGYAVAGNTRSIFPSGPSDEDRSSVSHAYLIKTDQSGNILWERIYGSGTTIRDLQPTADGGYIAAGNSGASVYLLKVSQQGAVEWERTYGGLIWTDGYSVQQTADGGYVILGGTFSGNTSNDVYLIKTDGRGNRLWEKTYGGSRYDMGYSVRQTRDGGYILTGFTWSFRDDGSDVYLIKTDAYGETIWSRTHKIGDNAWGHSVQPTRDGGYVITGYTMSLDPINLDLFLLKTDENGDY